MGVLNFLKFILSCSATFFSIWHSSPNPRQSVSGFPHKVGSGILQVPVSIASVVTVSIATVVVTVVSAASVEFEEISAIVEKISPSLFKLFAFAEINKNEKNFILMKILVFEDSRASMSFLWAPSFDLLTQFVTFTQAVGNLTEN